MPQSLQTAPPRRRGRPAEPLNTRILRLTDRTGECWLWLARRNSAGYGTITVAKRQRAAHRVSYETFVGPVPEGLELDHLCRVRHCVNPVHLEPVTHAENMRRAIEATGMVGGRRAGGMQLGETCSQGHVVDGDNVARQRGLIRCLTCRRESARLSMSGGKPRQRTYTDHVKAAAEARSRAGEWVLVATPKSAGTAYHTAHFVRTGKKLASYRPAGAFEAKHRKVNGGFEVFARFVGSVEGGVR